MGQLVAFAKEELRRIRSSDEPDEMQDAMDAHILKMVEAFADEGHSGFSASYALGILTKVLAFEPVTPLTGEDDEWTEVSNGIFQNRRCPHVFKENGEAYDIDAVVFREPEGGCFTNSDSRRPVTFPYTPAREHVDVPADR